MNRYLVVKNYSFLPALVVRMSISKTGHFSIAFRQPTYDVRKVSIFLKEKVHLPIRNGP